MFAKLASLAGVGSSLPFSVDAAARYEPAWGNWAHCQGTLREDGSAVSVFRLAAPKTEEKALEAARNGVKRLRTMRHPNVLSFKETAEIEERSEIAIYLVTEPVKPLAQLLDELNLEGEQRGEYLTMGLYHVAGAVSFLNNNASMIHGNVCMAAVVVTPTLDWKLHGLDLMSEHAMTTRPPPLAAANWKVGSQYIPGEVGKSEWDAVAQGPPWAVDAWGVGCLIQEVYSGNTLSQIDQLRDTERIPEGLLQDYQRLLSSQPTRRLNPAKLVSESGFLKNSLVNAVAFLENLSVKDSAEKDQFFRKLPNLLLNFPQPVCVQKFLPMLQRALEYGGAPPIALSAVMKIGNGLEAAEFQARVVPIVTKLFTSQERAIRKSLLENIELFGPHLTQKVSEDQIYPEVAKGFTDTNEYLRELTLRSMLTLAPKLSQRTLNNSLLKYLAKLQVDEKPGIRANTTVLLGNLAPYLGDVACKRVLLNAFTRALKDAFPPARVAALKALVATADMHSPEEVAQRVLPSVTAFTVDPIKDVRKSALQCLDTYIRILKKHAAAMDKREEAAAAAATASGAPAVPGTTAGPIPTAVAPAPNQAERESSGYLSWAASFMSSSSAKAEDGLMPAATSASGSSATKTTTVPPPAPQAASAPAPAAADDGDDGWGDDEDLLEGLDEQEDEAEKQARERLERLKKKPAPQTRPPTKPKVEGDAASEAVGDSDGVFEDMGMDAPKVKPRPRPASTRPKPAAKPKSKPMKLGAQKLGAQKLSED